MPGRPARQRRRGLHPRLLAAAPPPEAGRGGARAVPLRRADRPTLYESSKAILREAGYVGAGTCEFLVGQDGTISFLEVNTRLQVEHPVSEEVTGIDLVREMFRIAAGEELGYDDPEVARPLDRVPDQRRGRRPQLHARPRHADPLARRRPARASGSTAATTQGETVPGAFDSLVAKLIVTGRDRTQALERSRRALAEFVVDGMPTVHPVPPGRRRRPGVRRADGDEPFGVYTRWIETEFDNQIAPYAGDAAEADEPGERETVTVEVGGKRLEVVLPAGLGGAGRRRRRRRRTEAQARRAARRPAPPPPATRVTSPDAGHHRQGRRRGGPAGRRGRRRSSSSRR